MTYVPKSNVNTAIPIGTILGIHPQSIEAKTINSMYWKLCDDTDDNLTFTYPDGTTTESISRPNLMNSVFLSGTNGTSVSSGGANTMYDHKHSTNSADLMACGQSHTSSPTSEPKDLSHCHNIDFGLCASAGRNTYHCHGVHNNVAGHIGTANAAQVTGQDFGNYSTVQTGVDAQDHHHCTNYGSCWGSGMNQNASHSHTVSIAHTHSACAVTGTVGQGNLDVNDGGVENRPSYFVVRYYIKVK